MRYRHTRISRAAYMVCIIFFVMFLRTASAYSDPAQQYAIWKLVYVLDDIGAIDAIMRGMIEHSQLQAYAKIQPEGQKGVFLDMMMEPSAKYRMPVPRGSKGHLTLYYAIQQVERGSFDLLLDSVIGLFSTTPQPRTVFSYFVYTWPYSCDLDGKLRLESPRREQKTGRTISDFSNKFTEQPISLLKKKTQKIGAELTIRYFAHSALSVKANNVDVNIEQPGGEILVMPFWIDLDIVSTGQYVKYSAENEALVEHRKQLMNRIHSRK